uniref:PLAT domain-containing protein n=1 Tax=Plectus sambesii TaxID=2011161 RepID=A0A914XF46_9BILA
MLSLFFTITIFCTVSSLTRLNFTLPPDAKRDTSATEDRKKNDIEPSVWDVIIKTCDLKGAGTDANAYLKIYYEDYHDSEVFELDHPDRNNFEQGARDHFKLRFKQNDVINMGLFWWPGYTLSEHWCVDWVILANAELEMCFEGIFDKWILHYSDPPTYAKKFHRLDYASCINPPDDNVVRYQYRKPGQ